MKDVPNRCLLWLTLFLLGFCANVRAQTRLRRVEEPQWLKWKISEADAGVYGEGTFEEAAFDGGAPISHDHLFVGPGFGLNLEGSVYHPYLFQFLLNTEGAYGWGEDTITTGTTRQHRGQMEYLGRIYGNADILANKPIHANLFGNYDHSFRDYDFFTRVAVDGVRYGGQVGYDHEPFSVNLSYSHRKETASGLVGVSSANDDVLALQMHHTRQAGATSFDYTYNQYARGDLGRIGNGNDHALTLADSETFGSRDQFTLNSSAAYFRRNFSEQTSDDFLARANLGVEHRPDLGSFYDLTYDHYHAGAFQSDNYNGQAQLHHQLYDSLASTLLAQAADNELSDRINSGYIRRIGIGFNESYTKRIGDDHRVTLNTSLLLEHVDQQSITTVENERHTFVSGTGGAGLAGFFLNQPGVIELTVVITDQNDTPPAFMPGIDYGITTFGSRTRIDRLPGSRIPSGSTVLVDYRITPTGAGNYDSLNGIIQLRFDLWKNIWGLYAGVNLYVNNAPFNLRIQDLTSFRLGSDVTWRWLRTGAEYEIYDSNLADYRTFRLFQSFSFKPDDASTLGIDFSESWTDYGPANRKEENYRFITLYHRGLTRYLRLDLEGGIHSRQGLGVDQTLATVRPGLEYVIGKTSVRAEYDYEYQLFLNREERQKHLFIVRAKRVF